MATTSKKQLSKKLRKALAQLSEVERQCFYTRYMPAMLNHLQRKSAARLTRFDELAEFARTKLSVSLGEDMFRTPVQLKLPGIGG